MTSENFKKWNLILGWGMFLVALLTYTLTLEPTVSSWDCGEYIATSVKLQVGHPPGAPLFQMLGAFFAMFASDAENIAMMVNFMSALASAFTILFMFWTLTNLGQKLAQKSETFSEGSYIAILGSAVVGSLAYTFSDSFWFSAVEGEVYAMSSFLMAILFWLGLKWESEINTPRGNKWLIIISLVVGMSFGVHILSLLVIPSIVLLYFFKTYHTINIKTTLIATVISVLVLAFVFKFLFPITLQLFSSSELFFINTIGLPYNSGTIIFGVILIALFYFVLNYTRKKQWVMANTLTLSILFIMIGFSTWLMLPIRANANTAINENDPSNARELLAYYNREQYGDANVFYDKYYSYAYRLQLDADNPFVDGKPKYEKKNGKYVIINEYKNTVPNYSSRDKGFIPRMTSTNDTSIRYYKDIADIPKNSTRRPTFAENLQFMIDYQFGYMYGRYFMWNFVGRQNDTQGQLDPLNGNWISGISAIDQRLTPQENMPSEVLDNKGRNTYYFLPFILGLIGLFYQIRWDPKNFYTLLIFFLFTGFAIIFYTNPKPFEPRERDYAVVGSFYIFAIWIGFGVYALFTSLSKVANKKMAATAVSVLCLLAVPILMGSQNWDDHDRSNRYTTRLNAQAYLESCDPNAIMFTIGDNDTFPLWYMQEVEGVRTDIKLVNTSLFATDWYIDQMKRATYDAPPIPSQLEHDQYRWGTLDVAYLLPGRFPQFQDSIFQIDRFMRWIESDNINTFYDVDDDGYPDKLIPTDRIRIPVNKENALKYGIVAQKDADKIVDYIDIKIDRGITKNRILMLDILANFDWKRPIYFTGGAYADEEYIWAKDYLQLDGMAYKLVPIKTSMKDKNMFDMGRIDPEKMYANIQKLEWRNINDGKIYLDEQTKKNAISLRNNLMRLAEAFYDQGDTTKAIEVLDLSIEKMPIKDFGHFSLSLGYPEIYYKFGETEKARAALRTLHDLFSERLVWYSEFSINDKGGWLSSEIEQAFYIAVMLERQAEDAEGETSDFVKELQSKNAKLFDLFKDVAAVQ
jgi:tetratricopeptide (TPR) repeat protein